MGMSEANAFDPHVHCAGIFDRLSRFTPEQRGHLFYALENRWCWDCGEPQSEGDHADCGDVDILFMHDRGPGVER